MYIDQCDFERDVAPSLSNIHQLDQRLAHDGLADGVRYRLGPGETRMVIGTEVFELTPPVLGAVDVCVVYAGDTYYCEL